MSFLAPAALLLLLLSALILWLHIRRHRMRPVPSLHVWRRLRPGSTSRSPAFSWPRPSWLLALQLIALALLTLALAQPLWGANELPDHEVFVLDASGSMRAAAGSGTRFDAALAQMQARIRRAAAEDNGRVSLVVAGSPVTAAFARLPAAQVPIGTLPHLRAGDGNADWNRTADLIAALVVGAERTRITVLTDDVDSPAALLASRFEAAEVEIAPVGGPIANAAIEASLAPPEREGGPWRLIGHVTFSGDLAATRITVAVQPDGAVDALDWAIADIARPDDGTGTRPFTMEFELPGGALVAARLAADADPHDDARFFVVREAAPPRELLYLGPGNQPLVAALEAAGEVRVTTSNVLPADVSPYALVVIDGVAVDRVPATSSLWIGSARVVGDAPAPTRDSDPIAWNSVHPLAAGIDWSAITVEQAFPLTAAAGEATLLGAASGPLIVAADSTSGRLVRLAFDPRSSNWPEQTSFPAFAQNVWDWLGLQPGQVPAGCVVGLPCLPDIRLASGNVADLADADETTMPARGFVPQRAGFYRFEAGDRAELVAVNEAGHERSDLASPAPEAAGSLQQRLWRFAPWLIGAGLLVLVLEGWLAGRGPERFLHRSSYAASNPLAPRRRVLLGLRAATLLLVLAALLELTLRLPETVENVVVVADAGSAATGGATGLVAAGEVGGVIRDIGGGAAGAAAGAALALSDALAAGAAMLPPGESGHLVLAARAGAGALDGFVPPPGLRIDLAPPETSARPDAAVEMAEAPQGVYAGDSFALAARISATDPGPAELVVAVAGRQLARQPVTLAAGDNRIEIPIPAATSAAARYDIAIVAPGDVEPGNDHASVLVEPARPGRLAIVTPQPAAGEALLAALGPADFVADILPPDGVPETLEGWLAYDAMMLMNVPALALDTAQQQQIEQAVGEHGRGLLILGGENSFGPGGYLQTPLDRLSPISSKVPREAPQAALMFVLDRSGSMQQAVGQTTRMDIAKQATVAAVGLLDANSEVGIVVFDAKAQLLVPLAPLSTGAVGEAMRRLNAAGGTAIYPGLEMAFQQLQGSEAPTRHAVVMTDGLSKPGDFVGLLRRMREAGITVSTVAIGEGDLEQLEGIAAAGGGAFHATRDFEALPSILSQEAVLLSGDPIEERTATPFWRDRRASFLAGLPDTMPAVHGYVLTTAKPEAALHLAVTDVRGEEMPLLASWRYGSGQVVALTSHGAGRWTRDWLQRPEVGLMWSQAIRSLLPNGLERRLDLHLLRRGDRLLIEADGLDEAGQPARALRPVAEVRRDGVPLRRVSLEEVAPGRYAADLPSAAPGVYAVRLLSGDDVAEAALDIAFPSRLSLDDNQRALAALAIGTGGQVLEPGDDLAAGGSTIWVERLAAPHWLALALVLFLLDLLVRYGPSWLRPGSARR